MSHFTHSKRRGGLFPPPGVAALAALLLVLPFAPAAHGITEAECTGTIGGSSVAWDTDRCVLLDRLNIIVAGDLDNAATQLETRSGWTAEKKLPLVKVILAKYTGSQNLDLAGIKAERDHFSSQSWAAIVELDAIASAAQLVPGDGPAGGTDGNSPAGSTDGSSPVGSTGSTAETGPRISVAVDNVPSFADEAVGDQDYTQYARVESWTLPSATGGDGNLSYSLSPELPAGLTFDGTSRTISGTPAVALVATAYTFTATDADGDITKLAFNITVAAPAAQTLTKLSGDEQQGPGGATLGEPFVVSLLDQAGNPYPGAAVTFAITAGQGSLSVTLDTTDAEGRAAATLTLGGEPGTYFVKVTAAGLDPVTFTATAKAASDFNSDGVTDFSDFFLFADAFGGSDPRFDLDGSGSVDFADLFLFAEQFDQPARAKLVAMAREMIGLPDGPQLQQNAPNPFNSQTVISYHLLRPGPARVEVFALTGQRVAVLHEGPQKAGQHRLHWDGRDDQGRSLASGVYLYRLVSDEGAQTRKLILLR